MAFFSVTTTISNGRGGEVLFVFEVPEAHDLQHLRDLLADDGSVVGTRYQHRTDQVSGKAYLKQPKQAMVTLAGLALAEPYEMEDGMEIRD